MSVLDNLRGQQAADQAEFDRLTNLPNPSPADVARAQTLNDQLDQRDAAIDRREALGTSSARAYAARAAAGAPAYDRVGRVVSESHVYSERSNLAGTSFFSDLVNSQLGDHHARERIERSQREAEVDGRLEQRAVTTGGFAGLVVPQYLTQLAALAARAGRPVANAVTRLPLPDQGMSLIVPRGTTGASATSQATENSTISSTDEVWANLTVPVVTIAGQQDLSRQSVERGIPGLDAIVFGDLVDAYAAELDRQVIAGSGASNQMLGWLNTAGINQATAFAAAATATTFYLKVAGAINSIESAGSVVGPADLIVMHPRRLQWLLAQVDTQGRPLATPVVNGLQLVNGQAVSASPGGYSGQQDSPTTPSFTGVDIRAYVQGLPVITDTNIPTSQGSGPEDLVYVVSTRHQLLFEAGDGLPTQVRYDATLSNQLTIKLVAYGYAAFTGGRYPTAVSQVGGNATAGNGLVSPAF
jgi:HK97 family phage major capsid protein